MGVGTRVSDRLSSRMSTMRRNQQRKSDERFAERFAQQWAAIRPERKPEEPPSIRAGESNYSRAQVPFGVDLAAAWSWRFLVLVAAGYVIARAVGFFSLVVMPVVIALFLAALLVPLVNLLAEVIHRGVATFLVVV